MKLQLKRSNVIASGAAKIPTSAQLEYGELAINYNQQDPAIFLKDSNNNVIRIGGIGNIADDGQVELPTTTNPPTSPTPQNGNLWYNSEDGRLYVYYVDANSSQWVDASPDTWQSTVIPDTTNPAHQAGTLDDRYVNINGDTLTGALLLDNAAAVATPDLAFDGDLNTGIFSPGADSLAITTAGTQRVTVDSSGRVGIGKTSINTTFEIYESTNPYIYLQNSTTGTGAGDGFSIVEYGLDAFINNREAGNMLFFNNGSERLRIDSLGRVGVGTSSPQNALHAYHATDNGVLRLESGDEYVHIEFKDPTTTNIPYIGAQGNNLRMITGGAAAVTIDSSQRVGIGTSSPTTKCVISNGGAEGLEFGHGSGTNEVSSYNRNTSARAPVDIIAQTFEVLTGNPSLNTGLFQDSSGKVGIGTTSPSTPLHIKGAADCYLTLQAGATDGNNGILFQNSAGTQKGVIFFDTDNDYMFFSTNNTERMRIDSSGRVGIGTSSPRGKLEVSDGTSNTAGEAINEAYIVGATTGSSEGILTIQSNNGMASDKGGSIAFGGRAVTGSSAGANWAFINGYKENGTTGNYGGYLSFATRPNSGAISERMRIDDSGKIKIGMSNYGADVSASNPGTQILNESTGHIVTGTSTTSAANHHLFFNPNGLIGSIKTTNSATSFNTSSDYRLKENVVGITDGITRVKQLSPSRFNFIVDDTKTVDGFIAHEAQAVVPEAVTGTKDEVDDDGNAVMQGIDQSKLVPLLTAALQEAIGEIETLKQRLSDAGIA